MKEPAPVPRKTAEEVAELLKEKYSADEIQEAFSDIQELIDREELFTADIYKDYVMDFKKRQTVVKALCLHIAHDCNLACTLLFCGRGGVSRHAGR